MVMISFEDIVHVLLRSSDVLSITYTGDGLEFKHCVDGQWNAAGSVDGPWLDEHFSPYPHNVV